MFNYAGGNKLILLFLWQLKLHMWVVSRMEMIS